MRNEPRCERARCAFFADNCLLNGCTMDYGPFGFVEKYDPTWSPFTSDMERKFGFENQPLAARVNVSTFVKARVAQHRARAETGTGGAAMSVREGHTQSRVCCLQHGIAWHSMA